ncbi:MAG: porin [Deltaproteobacteria bacterium]|nr:MAG: porin [Deltaproteobacteria bacterium]
MTYNFPGLPDLQLKGGKFVTLLGAEVIESPLNYNISHSLAFSFSIPFTHTGLLMSYAFAPQFKATLGVVNGWDNVIDSNDGKTVTGSLAFAPADQFSFALNGLYGAEQPSRGDSKRGIIDVVATIKPVDNLTLSLNYDYGNETDLGPPALNGVLSKGNTTEAWQAFSGVVAYDLPDVLAVPIGFAVRGEYFDDSNGTRLPGATFGRDQNTWEVTSTFKVVLAEGLMARAEYRYDKAKDPVFLRNVGGVQKDQQTLAAELSYVF